MFIDGRQIPAGTEIHCEICIVGGGPAGITLARELERRGRSVCLLEAGGLRFERRVQADYGGEAEPASYDLLSTRTRQFGGSSNCWAGWNRPLSAVDVRARSWVPFSGWPIGLDALEPYWSRTHQLLELGDSPYAANDWAAFAARHRAPLLPLEGSGLENIISKLSPPTRFGKVYRDELGRSAGAKVILHAPVTKIVAHPDCRQVEALEVGPDLRFTVRARSFVLAAGGIENARLLLASRDQCPAGLGNGHDMVGRFFMDHPRLRLGKLFLRPPHDHSRYYDVSFYMGHDDFAEQGVRTAASIGLDPHVQEAESLLQCHFGLVGSYLFEDAMLIERGKRLFRAVMRRNAPPLTRADILAALPAVAASALVYAARATRSRRLVRYYALQAVLEPQPDPDNRVRLTEARDSTGLQRAAVRWRVGDVEKRTYLHAAARLGRQLATTGLGRVEMPSADAIDWDAAIETTWHHMGTTRMSESPATGVVDPDCRVHGIGNLYVAGSSVFPTGGGNMPTINIVALALRLADHLAGAPQRTRH